jgi:Uma2 family endonuclease
LSAIDRPDRLTLPPLTPGQRLDRATFHERYSAMPEDVRAELVEGIVYMPSPLSYEHGHLDHVTAYWLGHYRRRLPTIGSAGNATTILGVKDEVQPDCQLRIREESGGSTRIVDGFVSGPPELVVEIGKSSRSYDLGPKKAAYERAGVREYLFLGLVPEEVRWFALRDGRYVELVADADGLYHSEVFPGLWLDATALFAADLDTLIAALDRGLATPEHAAFAARLEAAGRDDQYPQNA